MDTRSPLKMIAWKVLRKKLDFIFCFEFFYLNPIPGKLCYAHPTRAS
jgi:hypothetical protein